jgi:hypothetical protein
MRLLLWQLPRRRRPEPMFRAPGSRGQSSAVGSERYLPEGDINEERVSLGAIPIVMSLGKAVHGSSALPDPATGAVGALAASRHDRHAKRAATGREILLSPFCPRLRGDTMTSAATTIRLPAVHGPRWRRTRWNSRRPVAASAVRCAKGWIRAVLFRQPTVFAGVKPSDTTGDHALDTTWAGSASLRHYPRP